MKVRELKTNLEKMTEKTRINPLLTSISHWVRRIFDSSKGQYVTRDFNDIETLEKLAEFSIVSLRKGSGDNIIAELTNDGKELFKDFTALGYYL